MNGLGLLGIVLVIYAAVVVYITIKKPKAIWEMAKIKVFIKVLGEKGTVIFFYAFAAIAAIVGIWLMLK